MSYPVVLHIYDLSCGNAAKESKKLIGQKLKGVWSTGVVIHGKEFYYADGICFDLPGCTPQGKPTLD